jgi:hypothetical protein
VSGKEPLGHLAQTLKDLTVLGHTDDLLNDVRRRIAADDPVLDEGRTRLHLVRDIAAGFLGALRTYASGSLAHHTVNHPVTDGDGGLVLDRRRYPQLGPEGGGASPTEVTEELCHLLGPAVRETYPNARCGTSKRGPKLWFGQPLNEQDPTVDLVVALTRREGPGLWIPNLKKGTWEASDPEQHTALLNGDTVALRRTRRHVIRLAKAWNKQFSQPGLSSFNLSAIALTSVGPGVGLARCLQQFFATAVASLAIGTTPDPAGVSAPLKLLVPRATVVRRLQAAADNLAEALAQDDDQLAVQTALHRVFWDYVDKPAGGQLASAIAALRPRTPVTSTALGLAGPPALVVPTRAYGDPGQPRRRR